LPAIAIGRVVVSPERDVASGQDGAQHAGAIRRILLRWDRLDPGQANLPAVRKAKARPSMISATRPSPCGAKLHPAAEADAAGAAADSMAKSGRTTTRAGRRRG
jgi:hypothetical protein